MSDTYDAIVAGAVTNVRFQLVIRNIATDPAINPTLEFNIPDNFPIEFSSVEAARTVSIRTHNISYAHIKYTHYIVYVHMYVHVYVHVYVHTVPRIISIYLCSHVIQLLTQAQSSAGFPLSFQETVK